MNISKNQGNSKNNNIFIKLKHINEILVEKNVIKKEVMIIRHNYISFCYEYLFYLNIEKSKLKNAQLNFIVM